MTKSIKLIALLLSFTLVFGTSCKKYEEGPNISLLSKKSRLVNVWKIDRAVDEDGKDDPITQAEKDGISYEFKKDNTYVISINIGTYSGTESGTWEFTDSKNKVKTTDSDGDIDESTILLLKKDELGLKNNDGSKIYFVTK